MSDLLTDLIPTNFQTEKVKFFQDFSYNPQLTYVRTFTKAELTRWGKPNAELTKHAEKMLKAYVPITEQETYVDEEYILQKIELFNQMYHVKEPIIASFSKQQVTKCRVNGNHIYFQLPIRYTASKLADLLRHELETHVLRFLNNQQQDWGAKKIDGISFRKTEEGLAGLHTHLLRKDKVIRKSYLTYLAVSTAQKASFSEVFRVMREQKVSPETSWNIALRTKRGVEDTSQPGGLTKDISYLEGSVLVWQWLMKSGNHAKDLYIGRIGLADLPDFLPMAKKENLVYPHFLDDYEQYISHMDEIGKVNHFDQLTFTYDGTNTP